MSEQNDESLSKMTKNECLKWKIITKRTPSQRVRQASESSGRQRGLRNAARAAGAAGDAPREHSGKEGSFLLRSVDRCFLSTAAVWCVPFFGTVGLFNKLQSQKKKNAG